MSNQTKWLSIKDDISKASMEELKNSLLTTDGCGKEFKEKILEEIITRTNKELSDTIDRMRRRAGRALYSYGENLMIDECFSALKDIEMSCAKEGTSWNQLF
jgi:hypothetical protein